MQASRRTFIIQSALAGASLAAARATMAATAPMVAESDPQAKTLGYVADHSKADKAKFPKFSADQKCSGCALFKAGADKSGACALFPGKSVSATGWCSAWAKKA